MATVSQLGLDPTLTSRGLDEHERLKKACEKFEGLFLAYMLKVMRESVPDSGLLGNGFGKEVFETLFDQALGEKLAARQEIGLSRILYRQLSRTLDSGEAGKSEEKPRPLDLLKDVAAAKPTPPGPTVGRRPPASSKPFENLDDIVNEVARQTDLDPELLHAVIEAESGGDPDAVSSKGALGLMQLMPATAREMGVTNPLDPFENVLGGARYLSRMLERFRGNLELALAAYNAGPSAVERHGGVPPYRETRHYVEKVARLFRARKGLVAAQSTKDREI